MGSFFSLNIKLFYLLLREKRTLKIVFYQFLEQLIDMMNSILSVCFQANEFDLTKPGTKFHRPDGLADSDEDNELYFMSDIQALESIVSDRGLAHEKISGRLTTGKMR